MKGIRRRVIAVILLCLTMCFTGCGEEELVSEDFQRGNSRNIEVNSIMKTDKGFYYSQGGMEKLSLYYYDSANGKSMYLCNKPECRHEGDEFCAATSDKYYAMETVMYSGSLYVAAVEETETAYKYKLLKASLDGSSLSEVVTYFEADSVDVMPFCNWKMYPVLTIHRNKVFLPYELRNRNNSEIGMNGTAIYDLATGELTYLGEKDRGLKEQDINFMGCGDYMYFATAQKFKTKLYRYSYADGSVEMMDLENNFKGEYALYDENTIFYIRAQKELFKYNHETKENTRINTKEWNGYNFEIMTTEGMQPIVLDFTNLYSILSDGEYVYIPEGFSNNGFNAPRFEGYDPTHFDDEGPEKKNYIEVTMLDCDGNYVNHVEVSSEDLLGYSECFTLHILEDAVYMQTPFMVYECSKEDFIAGNASFKEVYPLDIGIHSVKEEQ